MITFKRSTPTIDTTLANTSKYLNQMQFTGITEENNLFVTDQQSARDAVNVYTDIDGHFVSRPTLQKDKTIDKTVNDLIENYNHKLVELYSIGIGKLYITVNTNDLYSAIIVTEIGATYELSDLPKYHISIIEHYVICFNNKENVGAQVFDTNEPSKGWQSLLNFAEIPVIKRVVGSQETLYEKNNFTESYKEEYIWSNNSRPNLPEGYCNLVEMKSEHTTSRFSGSNINVIPEYAIMKELPIKVTDSDLITCAKNRICIAYSSYFLFSVNNGRSFTYIYYPDYQGRFLNIASISEDGQYFFFVTSYAVYRCNLGDLTWSEPIRANSGNLEDNTNVDEDIPYYGRYNTCCFLTGDIFSFYVYNGVLQGAGTARLYFKGPGLFSGKYGPVLDNNNLPVYKLNYIELDNVTFAEDTGGNSRRNERETAHQVIKMYITQNLYGEDIAGLVAYIHPWAGYTLATGYNLDSYQMHYLRGETLLSRGGIENSILYFNTILSYRHLATLQIFDSVNKI